MRERRAGVDRGGGIRQKPGDSQPGGRSDGEERDPAVGNLQQR